MVKYRAYEDIGAHGMALGDRTDPFNLDFDKQFMELSDEYESVRTIQKNCYKGTKKTCFNVMSLLFGDS